MASMNFKVEKADGWKALPFGTVGFTQNGRGEAYFAEAEDPLDLEIQDVDGVSVTGEEVYSNIPYRGFDAAKQYYIRAEATCRFGLVTE